MKRLFAIVILAAAIAGCARAQKGPAFDAWFVDRTMRVDYFHAGHATEETFALDQVYDQGLWAGSRAHLIDPFDSAGTWSRSTTTRAARSSSARASTATSASTRPPTRP